MKRAEKVIITCAVTGSVHTPSMSSALPVTPHEIAEQGTEAAAAGASVLHLHARDPEDGRPTCSADVFMEFLPSLKQSTNAVINITTGGSNLMTLEDRLEAPLRAAPELASLNMGTMNFVFADAAKKVASWKYDWEREYVLGSRDRIARNTFTDIERICRDLGEGCGTRFEFECYDVGHLYTLEYFLNQKLVEPPLFIQCIFGVLGGVGADPDNLAHMISIADKLFGQSYYLSVLAAGRHQMPFVTQSALCGGHVRVGLEDSLYLGPKNPAPDNASQVRKIRSVLEELSLEIASPDEARSMLQLKGGHNVNF